MNYKMTKYKTPEEEINECLDFINFKLKEGHKKPSLLDFQYENNYSNSEMLKLIHDYIKELNINKKGYE
jgi:hypothetical protein